MISSEAIPRNNGNVIKNLAILYAANILTMFLSLAPIAFLPKYLDAVGVGKLAIASSLGGIFGAVIVMGTAPYIVREIARDRQHLSEFVSGGVVLRTGLAVLLFPILAAVLYLFNYPAETRIVALSVYVGLALGTIGQTFSAALQALEVMTWRSAATVASKLVIVTLGWLVLRQGGGVMGYVLVGLFATVIEVGVYLVYFRLIVPLRPVISRRMIKQIFHGGLPFFIWFFVQTLYQQASTLMLSKLGGEEAVGWLNVGNQFMSPLYMIPSVVVTVLLPQFSQLFVLGPGPLRQSLSRAMNHMTIITVPVACGLAAVADQVIALFSYPPTFLHSVPVLQVLVFMLPGSSLLMIAATALTAMNKERTWARISIFSLIMAVLFNWLLIPLGHQRAGNAALGAASAMLLVELCTCIWAFWLIGQALLDRQIFVTIGKTLLAGSMMAAVVRAMHGLPLPVIVPLGAALYIGAALLLKVLPPEDLQSLRTLAAKQWRAAMTFLPSLFTRDR